MRLLVWIAMLPLVSVVAAQGGDLPTMRLDVQSVDGNAADVEGPSETSSSPDEQRVWFAGARHRSQIQVVSRKRITDEEDPLISQFETRIADLASDVTAATSPDDRLFTLTSRLVHQTEAGLETLVAKLHVDHVQNPTAPFRLQTIDFAPTENPLSLCTIPDEDKLLVILPNEIRVYDYSAGVIDETAPWPGVATMPSGNTTCSASLKGLLSATTARINTAAGEKTVAFVLATVNDVNCAPNKPQATALLVCDLSNPQSPAFYSNLLTQAWQPCRSPTSEAPCADYRINSVAHVRTNDPTPKDLVYVAAGKLVQLRELDVTNIDTGGIVENGVIDLGTLDNYTSIYADPDAPGSSDYLYVVGQSTTHVVDRVAKTFAKSSVSFGNGAAGTPLLMLADAGGGVWEREIWTLAMQNAPYVFRVTDFTQDGVTPLDEPDVSEADAHYAAGPADGAVANFDWDSAYLPTFGGVVRWDISGWEIPGTKPIPNPNSGSYQPARDPITLQPYTTEHIAMDDMGPGGPGTGSGWHLLTTTAEGSFFAWPIDPITKDPLPGTIYEPGAGAWPWTEKTYGNDILVAEQPFSGMKWVVFDYYRNPSLSTTPPYPNGEFGIGRFNWTAGAWLPAILWEDSSTVDPITPPAQVLAVEDKWLFVGGKGGFLVVDLQAGLVTDEVYVNRGDVGGLDFTWVHGLEAYYDSGEEEFWVFASLGDSADPGVPGDPDNGFALASYLFDPGQGKFLFPGYSLSWPPQAEIVFPEPWTETDMPVQWLFDGPTADDFPGPKVEEGGRLSVIELASVPSDVRIYSGSTKGQTLEIEFKNGAMTPLSYWNNGGHFTNIQDCNSYKVTLPGGQESIRVVLAKPQETFEVVTPPDMP